MNVPEQSIDSGGKPSVVVGLDSEADKVAITKPDLRTMVATDVLKLFKWSLLGTLASSGVILIVDEVFIIYKLITPEQRLLSEKVLMTLIGATVVQVGAALAAIVFAVFKSHGNVD
jgi:hypothetical protein